jgi:zinc protease
MQSLLERRHCWPVAALALTLALAGPLPAQQPGEIVFENYELENGLRVLLAPDAGSTAVEVSVWYDAGSRREPPGRSGFAHLFEHLMFQGSENLPPGEHSRLVTRAGGVNNAYLIVDNTSYFQTLPPDRYNLGLWLEAERMRALRITEENMRREIEVVKEERRSSYENSPYGMARLEAWFYAPYDSTGCFAYAHSQIGSPQDLDAATLDDVQRFFDTYYNPNNATLVVVGAFEPAEARALIQQYFGPMPRGPTPPPIECREPFRHLPVRRTLEDANATLPAVMHTYGTVPARHPDADALNLVVSILTDGESSRFHRRLVRDEQAALSASGFTWERLGPGLVWMIAVANQGVEVARIETLLDEELERVRREGVTQAELDKARNNYRASQIRERQTVGGRAEALQWHNHYLGDPAAIRARMERLMALTVEDLRRVANTYLVSDNRAIVITHPAGRGE